MKTNIAEYVEITHLSLVLLILFSNSLRSSIFVFTPITTLFFPETLCLLVLGSAAIPTAPKHCVEDK
jgi:hypothetical protein